MLYVFFYNPSLLSNTISVNLMHVNAGIGSFYILLIVNHSIDKNVSHISILLFTNRIIFIFLI